MLIASPAGRHEEPFSRRFATVFVCAGFDCLRASFGFADTFVERHGRRHVPMIDADEPPAVRLAPTNEALIIEVREPPPQCSILGVRIRRCFLARARSVAIQGLRSILGLRRIGRPRAHSQLR